MSPQPLHCISTPANLELQVPMELGEKEELFGMTTISKASSMLLITSFGGDDNNNMKQMAIMLNNKNSVQKFLQVHNNISTQDRSKKSHAFYVNAIDV